MSTQTLSPVVVESVPDLDPADESFDFGLADAMFLSPIPSLDSLSDDHPAGFAWDELATEVRAEIGPEVARLITEAFRRRLPWIWEPER